jgi:type III secretory pathway component EscS
MVQQGAIPLGIWGQTVLAVVALAAALVVAVMVAAAMTGAVLSPQQALQTERQIQDQTLVQKLKWKSTLALVGWIDTPRTAKIIL